MFPKELGAEYPAFIKRHDELTATPRAMKFSEAQAIRVEIVQKKNTSWYTNAARISSGKAWLSLLAQRRRLIKKLGGVEHLDPDRIIPEKQAVLMCHARYYLQRGEEINETNRSKTDQS